MRRSGQAGVSFCLAQFAKTQDTDRNRLREALVALKPLSVPALMGLLESSDADLRKQAAWALGQANVFRTTPLIAAQAVTEPSGSDASRAAQWAFRQLTGQPASSESAIRLLKGALRDTLGGVPPGTPNADGEIAVYQRAADAPLAIAATSLSADNARIAYAARLARTLLAVDPSSEQNLRKAIVLDLQARSIFESAGVAAPVASALNPVRATNSILNNALAEALQSGYAGAAAALCVTLGDRGDAAVLITSDGKPSPMAQALESPHPAVRFAALRGVMGLAPETPFPGSSKVAATLIDFAGGGVSRAAVVATPNIERSATLSGLLAGSGIEGRPTNRGVEAVELADGGDVEMVMLDLAVLQPNVRETVFRLRRQPATGLVPIGLLAPDGRLDEAKAIAKEHTGVLAFPRPHTSEAVTDIADALAAATPAGWPTTAERAELAEVARGWIAEVLEKGPSYFNLRGRVGDVQQALVTGGGDPMASLALLGTPASQLELLGVANRRTEPIATRQNAAKAFADSVERYGILLTTDQIEAQYDVYNASVASNGNGADAETQQVLSDVLDTIESKRKSSKAEGR